MREVSKCGKVARVIDSKCVVSKARVCQVECGKSKLHTVLRIKHVFLAVTKLLY